ncbi:MAG: LPS translocon maturation chaperone LptM [Trinickia sp.]|uniref:LPS translocon maturation chaperone LptM n=1 Tax=Trinickia sp. TaxID=2571163 RepID=UPI003F7F63F6
MSAIVAALAVATSVSIAGCGQRGPLYLPSVPPLPPKPAERTEPSSERTPAALPEPDAQQAPDDSASKPLMLAPADQLGGAASGVRAPSPASAASDAAPGANQ